MRGLFTMERIYSTVGMSELAFLQGEEFCRVALEATSKSVRWSAVSLHCYDISAINVVK